MYLGEIKMNKKPKIAVSVGDLNGIGIEVILKSHNEIKQTCEPVYCISRELLDQASNLLNTEIPDDFEIIEVEGNFKIKPQQITSSSGEYSFKSFKKAVELAKNKIVDAIVTMPINKEAWFLAGIKYKGHTEALRDFFKEDVIMLMGNKKLFVALFTEHIPLGKVVSKLGVDNLIQFFRNLHKSMPNEEKFGVLGVNPHAGDHGVLGNEEVIIQKAINQINEELKKEYFVGPIVPDIAFTPMALKKINRIVAMYHDQGLSPLKALYFDESINISLNLPIIRVSVDHGTAFDIAYQHKANNISYLEAVKIASNYNFNLNKK
jgi:4-hydroxythreonine-4-phosphate dehydrogenase